MPVLTVELSDQEYANALAFPPEERRARIAATFATAPNRANPPAPVPNAEDEDDYPRPFPYFDGDEVVTETGRRPRRPWDGVMRWDGVSTNPDDFPDFDDITAEQMASMCAGKLQSERDAAAGILPRDGKEVMREMRERLARGEFHDRPQGARANRYRNGK